MLVLERMEHILLASSLACGFVTKVLLSSIDCINPVIFMMRAWLDIKSKSYLIFSRKQCIWDPSGKVPWYFEIYLTDTDFALVTVTANFQSWMLFNDDDDNNKNGDDDDDGDNDDDYCGGDDNDNYRNENVYTL